MNNLKPPIRVSNREKLLLVALVILVLIAIGAFLSTNNHSNLLSAHSVENNHKKGYGQTSKHGQPPQWFAPLRLTHVSESKHQHDSVYTSKEKTEKRKENPIPTKESISLRPKPSDSLTPSIANETDKSVAAYTLWMTVATWVAAILLFPTLWYTIKASRTASKSFENTRATNVLTLQPWLSIGEPMMRPVNSDKSIPRFEMTIPLTNRGATPIQCSVVEFGITGSWEVSVTKGNNNWTFRPTDTPAHMIGDYFNPINTGDTFDARITRSFAPVRQDTPVIDFSSCDLVWKCCGNVLFKDISTDTNTHRMTFFMASSEVQGVITSVAEIGELQPDRELFDFYKKAQENYNS